MHSEEAMPRIRSDAKTGFEFSQHSVRGKVGTLKRWIKEAANSGITAITRFVGHLKRDQSAVENAVAYSWSNGPVEGHINRLKAVKRQMYGRAGFELLRSRVLPLAA